MRIKLVQRLNPLNRSQSPKYYAHAENEGVAKLDDLAKQITKYSSLSSGDILSVLENMIDAAALFLQTGRGVQMGRLGMFRIMLKSDGVATPEEFNCNSIRPVKVRFRPNRKFKKELEGIPYEMIK